MEYILNNFLLIGETVLCEADIFIGKSENHDYAVQKAVSKMQSKQELTVFIFS